MQTEWKAPESFPHVLISPNGHAVYTKTKKFVKLHDNGKGYMQIHTTIGGKQYVRYIHRLVAECYLENPNNYREINHKDGNKRNNNVENLEWCTSSYNKVHAYKTGLRHTTEKQRETSRKNVIKSIAARQAGWIIWSKTEKAKETWKRNIKHADRWHKKGAEQ